MGPLCLKSSTLPLSHCAPSYSACNNSTTHLPSKEVRLEAVNKFKTINVDHSIYKFLDMCYMYRTAEAINGAQFLQHQSMSDTFKKWAYW